MPWDGKDAIFRQSSVPVHAMVWLEQAKENTIVRMSLAEAMTVMLKQAMMPIWDDGAMDSATALMAGLAQEVPLYHLRCLPNEQAVHLTYKTIFREGK